MRQKGRWEAGLYEILEGKLHIAPSVNATPWHSLVRTWSSVTQPGVLTSALAVGIITHIHTYCALILLRHRQLYSITFHDWRQLDSQNTARYGMATAGRACGSTRAVLERLSEWP